MSITRRSFAAAVAAAGAGSQAVLQERKVDYRKLAARADLTYSKPVSRSEEGMPIGNGRMGTLVWTTPSAVKFQINRVDVFAENCATRSFPVRHTDYAAGCGYVDVDFVDFGEDVFGPQGFRQHLSVYDGVVTVQGKGVTAQVAASQQRDVIAIEIDDRREQASPVRIDLRMLRYAVQYHAGENWDLASRHTVLLENRNQTAASQLDIRQGRIVLAQQFREGEFYSASAVVIGAAGRKTKAKYASDSTVRLAAAPGKGRFTVLIASAASFDSQEDAAAKALAELEAAAAQSFQALLDANRGWWDAFWPKSLVELRSADGTAEFVEQNYTYFLYLMASCSRGKFPPRFGGLLFLTNGDMREWGSQYWWHNMSCYYDALPPVNRFELMDPMFGMYSGMLDSLAVAARQQWGSRGVWVPETVWFDGLDKMPDDLAGEMRDLYLGRKPWEQRSARFREAADTAHPHSSRWNWKGQGKWVEGRFVYQDKGAGPFGEVIHIFSSGAKIGWLYWLRYEYTQDQLWLRERAYPLLKGVAEFYRHYPNFGKGPDGKYHIRDVNDHEPIKGAQDTLEEMTAMAWVFPTAARAARILGVDAELQQAWEEIASNLAPIPTNDLPGAMDPQQPGHPRMWVNGLRPVRLGQPTRRSDHLLIPAIHYDYISAATEDAGLRQVAEATYASLHPEGVGAKTPINVLNRNGIAAARLGKADDVRFLLPNQLRCLTPERDFCDWEGGGRTGVLPNRLTLREGPGAIDAQRLGRAAAALHLALLQCAPRRPGEEPVIHLFPAWPRQWDADFTLHAAGAFRVSASIRAGKIDRVELRSLAGARCRLRNPWNAPVTIHRNGVKWRTLDGPLLSFETTKDDLLKLGTDPPFSAAG